jgi:lysyl-tRNA synthetase class I
LADDPWDGDWPVFDPKCPSCGRFYKRSEIRMKVNGWADIVEAKADCGRCGEIDVEVVCWRSDLVAY